MIRVDTPDNIDKLSDEELLELCSEGRNVIPKHKRLKLIKFFYEILRFDIPNDLLLALVDESDRQLLLAPAGGGKTTTVACKIAVEKLIRFFNGKGLVGERVLCLVYNSHNVSDFKERHSEIISRLKRSGMKGIDHLDMNVECRTMHSFCQVWLKQPEYETKAGIKGFKLIDSASDNTLSIAIEKTFKKKELGIPDRDLSSAILGLYNYMKETMVTLEQTLNTDKFISVGLDYETIHDILDLYEKVKKMQRKYDFTDMLIIFNRFIQEDEEFRNRIQSYYRYVTADEVQDFTPIMRSILSNIVAPTTPLTCIGDDDQAIYEFRGADSDTILNFKEVFDNSKVFLLRSNRRCPKNIINLASTVINSNTKRFAKTIIGSKPDGGIKFVGYNDKFGQYHSIINMLSNMSSEERSNTVICYRERNSSLALNQLIYNKRYPMNVLSGYKPFSYGLWNAVEDVLRALRSGNNKIHLLNLFKVLPVTRKAVEDALGYDSKKGTFKNDERYIDIAKIEFVSASKSFKEVFNFIVKVSKAMDTVSIDKYFPALLGLIYKYYWNNILRNSSFAEFDAFQREQILKFYCKSGALASEKAIELEDIKKSLDRDQYQHAGITLSTFHSLKGLEFDNVIIIDLDESIFPQTSRIDSTIASEESKLASKECETRLMYVAVTRTKKNLTLYYNKSNPSIYVNMLVNEDFTSKADDNKVSMPVVEFVDSGFETKSSKVSFNKKKDLFGRLK